MSSNDSNLLPELRLTEQEFNALDRENQEYYLHLLQEEVQYRKSRKILYYQPLEKVDPFHKSPAIVRALFGGNRSGKTTGGGMEFLFHITGQYPDWYPQEMRYKRAVKGRIIAKDFLKGVGEVIIPFFDEWLDPSLVAKRSKNPMGIAIKWYLKNGSVFDILTHEQSTEQFEGWKGDIAWFDEPPPRDKYIATTRGLIDFNGRHWLTLTPLTQPWIYDEIYTKHDGKRVFCVTMDMRDNKNLTEQAIRQFESGLTEEEKEARMHGKFMHLSGLVYKEFDPPVHIVESIQMKPDWTRYFAIDPHERTPTACLWMAADPDNNLWIYDELWLKDMDIESIAHAIHAQEGELLPRVRLIDPHADKDNAIAGGFNIRKELMRYGVYCQRANSDPALGKARIRQALTPRYSAVLKTEVPRLHITRNCAQTVYEFQHYIWDDYRRNKEEFDQKETVKKKNDHFMDALRYIFNFDPRYIVDESAEETEVEYAGKYAKYPIKAEPKGSYHSLVENPSRGGNF
jgi:phage terminase large subunit-like protein